MAGRGLFIFQEANDEYDDKSLIIRTTISAQSSRLSLKGE
jgi:hypothetical protein